MLTPADINSYIAKSQRALASYMLSAARFEAASEDAIEWYRKARYLSAGIRVLSWTNNALTNAEQEAIIQNMITCGEINDFSSSVIVFPAQPTLITNPYGGATLAGLLDGPLVPLSTVPSYYVRVNSAGTAWEYVAVSSIVGNITINRTVFVAKNGSDSTGLAERLDKPFLTLAAARTAAVALSPTSTNRVLIKVFSGTYLEGIVLYDYIDWDLSNAILDLQAGSLATIDDNTVVCNSIVYGNATLKRTTAGSFGCVAVRAASNVTVYCDSAVSARGATLYNAVGTSTIKARTTSHSVSGNATVACASGTQYVESPNTIGTVDGTHTVQCSGGTQTVRGNIYYGIIATGGTQTIYGNSINNVVWCVSATQTIYGNIISASNPSNEEACLSSGATAVQVVYGNINLTYAGASSIPAVYVGNSGTQTINGDITSLCTGVQAVSVQTSGIGIYNCGLISGVYGAVNVSATATINNSRLVATSAVAARHAIMKSGGTLILKNCTLIASTATPGYCISSPSNQSVKIYGACEANLAKDPTFTITEIINTISIDVNVT